MTLLRDDGIPAGERRRRFYLFFYLSLFPPRVGDPACGFLRARDRSLLRARFPNCATIAEAPIVRGGNGLVQKLQGFVAVFGEIRVQDDFYSCKSVWESEVTV